MIQNLMNGVAVDGPQRSDHLDGQEDYFQVQITTSEIDEIVLCLVKAGGWRSGVCPGQQAILQALLDDWRRLASAMDGQLTASR